jgi:hypothetical protein
MSGTYDAAQRRTLEQQLAVGGALTCPVCGGTLSSRPVEAPASVSYVRRRVWVLCTDCRRSASLDVKKPRR